MDGEDLRIGSRSTTRHVSHGKEYYWERNVHPAKTLSLSGFQRRLIRFECFAVSPGCGALVHGGKYQMVCSCSDWLSSGWTPGRLTSVGIYSILAQAHIARKE